MSTAPVTPAPPKVSFWHKFEDGVLKVLSFLTTKAAPIVQAAGSVVALADPALAPEISMAENIFSKIVLQAQVTQAAFAAVGQGANGTAKMQAVLAAISPEIDQWIANSFPGSATVSTALKQGVVQAIYNLVEAIDPNLANPTPTAMAAATAVSAALAAPKTLPATGATATQTIK